jgi:hypothetical protein
MTYTQSKKNETRDERKFFEFFCFFDLQFDKFFRESIDFSHQIPHKEGLSKTIKRWGKHRRRRTA